MKPQNYHNHVRVYPAHHFVFYPVIALMTTICVRQAWIGGSWWSPWALIALLTLVVGWLSFMTRQHYALRCQNRIVRLEMRLRFYQLTGKRLEDLEERLGFGRIAALRFAGDEELAALTERTLAEDLSPTEIKKAITYWQADHFRV